MFSWDMYFNHNRPFFLFFSFLLCCCFVLFCFYVSFTSFFLLKSCARFLFVAVFLWKKTFTDRTVCAACVCVCVRICVLTVIIQSNVVLLYSGTTSTTTLLDFHGQVGTHVKLPLLMPEQRHMLTILSVITHCVWASIWKGRYSRWMDTPKIWDQPIPLVFALIL